MIETYVFMVFGLWTRCVLTTLDAHSHATDVDTLSLGRNYFLIIQSKNSREFSYLNTRRVRKQMEHSLKPQVPPNSTLMGNLSQKKQTTTTEKRIEIFILEMDRTANEMNFDFGT